MPRYIRVPGGEKNVNSGKRWTKDELHEVLQLYLILPEGKGIHEHNEKIQILSRRLLRTVRSVEAQLLMFRSLDKGGKYPWGHMNKYCLELWNEYLDKIK